MKKFFTLVLLFVASCGAPVDDAPAVAPVADSAAIALDSIIATSNCTFEEIEATSAEVNSTLKSTIQGFVVQTRLLKEKVELTKATVIHDTVYVREVEKKNFWGRTKVMKSMSTGGSSIDTAVLGSYEEVDTLINAQDTIIHN